MGKKTIREAVSKVIYDNSIDTADVEVYFQHSSEIWVVPFNFIDFRDDGFVFGSNFYPLYKILAILDTYTGDFLIERARVSGAKRVYEVEFYEFPINLGAVYDEIVFFRNLPIVIDYIRRQVKKSSDLSWLSLYYELEKVEGGGIEVELVKEGALRGLGVVFISDKLSDLVPFTMASIGLRGLERLNGYQRFLVGDYDENSLIACFFGERFFCIDREYGFISVDELGLPRRVQIELMGNVVYFDSRRRCVVGIRSLKSLRCLSSRHELSLLKQLGLSSCFNLRPLYTRDYLDWLLESGRVRISDWDQLLVLV